MTPDQLRIARNVARVQAAQGCKVSAGFLHLYALHIAETNNADRIYRLRQMPPEIAPKGVPVLICGGIAMKKTGGEWFSGMSDEPFTRKLNWFPEWWSSIPNGNEPLHQNTPEDESQHQSAGVPPSPADARRDGCLLPPGAPVQTVDLRGLWEGQGAFDANDENSKWDRYAI
jgi:hypothetical protein